MNGVRIPAFVFAGELIHSPRRLPIGGGRRQTEAAASQQKNVLSILFIGHRATQGLLLGYDAQIGDSHQPALADKA
jgi:hypothetical protein